MKGIAWGVFLTFISISASANFLHGDDMLGGGLMAVVPVGFAAVIFLIEQMASRGIRSRGTYIAAGLVAFVAGLASYVGLYTMALEHGVPKPVALMLPIAFDGVVAVASLAIRAAGAVHRTKPVVIVNAEMNTDLNIPVNTSEGVQMNTEAPTVQADVSAAQVGDEHLNTEPVNTDLNTEANADLNTSEGVQMNTPKKPAAKRVNTPKPAPVNTDRAAELNTVREMFTKAELAGEKAPSTRVVAAALGVSTGKASGLIREMRESDATAAEQMEGVNLDAELAKLLADDGSDEK